MARGNILAPQPAGCGVESQWCCNGTGTFPQCTITELSKVMVCGALSMGNCT